MNLSKNVKVVFVKAGQTAATSAVNSDAVDLSGYEGVLFFGTIAVANAGNFLQVEQSTAENFATKSVLDGAKMAVETNGDVAFVDVFRPQEKLGKYLRASIARTASTATGDIYAILYNGRVKPEDYAKLAVSPAASV
ncbi:hypothetical protein [Candidatus Darwinibacter acetoxidans]